MPDPSAGAEPLARAGRLALDDDELVACVACGLCLPHCPTYRVTGLESRSPRGRIAAMRAVELGGAPVDTAFVDAMTTCVECRGCEAACPSSVPFGHLIEGTRASPDVRAAERRARPLAAAAEEVAFRFVLPRHRVLLALSWLLLVAQRLRLVPRRLGLPRLRARSLRIPLTADARPVDATFFPGCVMDAWQRDVHRDALAVMRATGARMGLPTTGADCCGALHLHAGRVGEARRLARRLIAAFPEDGEVVVDSAGCGAAMKEYGHLLGTVDAVRFAARVRDFSEWLAARGPLPVAPTGQTVVVQDPCHLRHVQHAHVPVRQVLGAAYLVREPADEGLCCGAGGAYSVLQPALAGEIRARKVAALESAAGDAHPFVVVSANPGCAMHLAAAGLTVRHPAELLAAALDPGRVVDPTEPDPNKEGTRA